MNGFLKLVVCLLLSDLVIQHSVAQRNESKEPERKYQLVVGSKTVTIRENQPLKVDGNFTNPIVKLKASRYREFPYMGVKFSYPQQMEFEADLMDTAYKSWTLVGNDADVMLFEIADEVSTLDFTKSMMEEFESKTAKITAPNIKAKFGNLELPGTRLEVEISSVRMRTEVIKLPSNSGKTKLIVFQHVLSDAGEYSKESKDLMDKIRTTFEFKN